MLSVMAIIKGTHVSGLKGKLGNVVFRNVDGKCIVSEKSTPRNPRTVAQVVQRMKFATLCRFWKIAHRYIGLSFREFISLNIKNFAPDSCYTLPSPYYSFCSNPYFLTSLDKSCVRPFSFDYGVSLPIVGNPFFDMNFGPNSFEVSSYMKCLGLSPGDVLCFNTIDVNDKFQNLSLLFSSFSNDDWTDSSIDNEFGNLHSSIKVLNNDYGGRVLGETQNFVLYVDGSCAPLVAAFFCVIRDGVVIESSPLHIYFDIPDTVGWYNLKDALPYWQPSRPKFLNSSK